MLLDFAELDKESGKALYLQLYSAVAEAVLSGKIKNGEKLPSIRETAAAFALSRTTVENAYLRLCIEGLAESSPQRGYFISYVSRAAAAPKAEENPKPHILYDFSTRSVDSENSDSELWKRKVREVLRDDSSLDTYGDSQGEAELRQVLASYAYKARGVVCRPENIIVGAGVGPLLNILCGLINHSAAVGIEGSFPVAEQVFSDSGISSFAVPCDANGAEPSALTKSCADILFLMSSALLKISVGGILKRRNEFTEWVNGARDRIIIEDDSGGELRYTARNIPAFQGKCPEKTVYIGSFSKLLLPGVRIAYMVLPDFLAQKFTAKKRFYNGTCGKIDQLALKSYIETGALERHLRRLRRIYSNKSKTLINTAAAAFPDAEITLYESSLTAEIRINGFNGFAEAARLCKIRPAAVLPDGALRLCFAGIRQEDIPTAIELLAEKTLIIRRGDPF